LAHASPASAVPDCELQDAMPMAEMMIAAGRTAARSLTRLAEPAAGGFQQEAAHRKAAVEDLAEQLLAGEDFGQGHLVLREHTQTTFRSVGRRRRVDGRHLKGELQASDPGEVDRETQQVGPIGERRQRPREGQGEVVFVTRFLVVGKSEHRVLEREEDPRIDFESEMEVERSAATLFGMEVHLPDLSERVGLDEVSLVVDVESVVDRVVLEVGHVAGNVNSRHIGRA
jgi:hypothetical protein